MAPCNNEELGGRLENCCCVWLIGVVLFVRYHCFCYYFSSPSSSSSCPSCSYVVVAAGDGGGPGSHLPLRSLLDIDAQGYEYHMLCCGMPLC